MAGVHGNEPAGRRAAAWIRHWPVVRGRLIVLPCVNALGARKNIRHVPDDKSYDLNRRFPSKGGMPGDKPLPASLWSFLERVKPDWLIDLHEAGDYRFRATAKRNHLGHSLICYPNGETEAVAKLMIESANRSTLPGKYAWTTLKYPIEGSIARAAATRLGAHAFIAETCKKDYLSVRVRHHRLLVHRLLTELMMLPEGLTPNLSFPVKRAKGEVRVALYNSTGTGGSSAYRAERCLPASQSFSTRRVTATGIREGILEQFDVVVFPGGSGSGTARALKEAGRRRVREFVEGGGGFLGICAGAYLATSHYSWSLGILDAKVLDTKHWARGTGNVKLEVTAGGRRLFGGKEQAVIYYGQGPILAPGGKSHLPDFETLAIYRSEVTKRGVPRGVMIGTVAAAGAPFGRGRVMVFSPHPESTRSLNGWLRSAARWLAKE